MIECKAFIYHVPHVLLPLIVNLRERVNCCFDQLAAVAQAEEAKESILLFLDTLAEGRDDDLQACEEYTNRQLANVELFLERTRLSLGRKTFSLTFAETAFFKFARRAVNEYDKDTTAGGWRVTEYLERDVAERSAKWKDSAASAKDSLPEELPDGLVLPRTADSKTDKQKQIQPDNIDVRDLCHKLERELPKGRTQIAIAREFTNNNEKKAQSLLRQVRRFPHLWKRADK